MYRLVLASLVLALALGCPFASARGGTIGASSPAGRVPTATPPIAMPAETPIFTAEQINAARKTADVDTALGEPDRKMALDLYDQALTGLKEAEAVQAQLTALDIQIRDAPKRIAEIRAALATLQPLQPSAADLPAPQDLSLDQIEFHIADDTLTLNQQKDALRTREDDLSNLLVGAKSLTEDIAARVKALDQLDKDLVTPPAADALPQVQQARTLALKARRQVRAAEIELLKKRLASSLLTDLAQSERDLLAAQVAQAEQRLMALKQREQGLREAKATKAREQAEAEARKAHQAQLPPEAQAVADANAHFRQELEGLVAQEQQVNDRLQRAGQGLDELKTDFDRTRQRVDVVGPSQAIGRMLRQRRAALPSLRDYRRESRERAEQISKVTDRQLEIDELLRESPAVEQALDAVLQRSIEVQIAGRGEGLETDPRRVLAQARRDSLNELQKVYSRYITKLTSLDIAERQRLGIAKAYVAYIDDQLLWIPSTGLLPLFAKGSGLVWGLWLFSLDNWTLALEDLAGTVRYWPGRFLLVGGLLLAVLVYRRRIPARLHEINLAIRKIRTDSFLLSLQALGLTALLALPLPLALLGLGYLLQQFSTARPFTLAVGAGLFKTGLLLGSLGFLRALCRNEGLGDRHLGWPEPVRRALLKVLRWLIPLAALPTFVVATTAGSEPPLLTQAVGGLAFIILMLASAVVAGRLLRHNGVIKCELLDRRRGNWASHLHFLWFPLAVGTPLALALTSILGYHYTAVRLEQQVQMTVWYFFGLLLLRDLILRGLFVVERRLRYEDALRRREEQRAQRVREEGGGEEEGSPIAVEIPEINYDSLSEQSRRLVHFGFLFAVLMGGWTIWNQLLPTLGFLNNTELPFHATRMIDGMPKEVAVTLGDMVIGLFFLLVTVLAAKNLPGILEISLLQRLPLDAGARYAVTALSQYSIAVLGVVIAFGSLGLEWSSIQWLVAALGVGLGFGLQEIVANFVSGIILLFERPIRVGDVVTIDGIIGVVSRIRIRATTIINYDKQELVVPNKEFITGRLINWTLTDKINRIVITIGVAYGSDVRQAMHLLAEAATENENVLYDPKPVTSFEGFGDNALTLVLRCYLPTLDNRLSTITALHTVINDKFAAAGIGIAFPQRDVHLVTTGPLEVRMQPPPLDAQGGQ